jgi:hypothetical protein
MNDFIKNKLRDTRELLNKPLKTITPATLAKAGANIVFGASVFHEIDMFLNSQGSTSEIPNGWGELQRDLEKTIVNYLTVASRLGDPSPRFLINGSVTVDEYTLVDLYANRYGCMSCSHFYLDGELCEETMIDFEINDNVVEFDLTSVIEN